MISLDKDELSWFGRRVLVSGVFVRLHLLRKSEFLDVGGSASYDASDLFEQLFFRLVRSVCSARTFGSVGVLRNRNSGMDPRGIIPLEFTRISILRHTFTTQTQADFNMVARKYDLGVYLALVHVSA